MADEVDYANELIASEVSRALRERQLASQQQQGAKHCIECGDDIPATRQKMGFKYCVACAKERERRKSLFADQE